MARETGGSYKPTTGYGSVSRSTAKQPGLQQSGKTLQNKPGRYSVRPQPGRDNNRPPSYERRPADPRRNPARPKWEPRKPKPEHVSDWPAIGRILGRRAGVLAAIIWPDPLNQGEDKALADYRMSQPPRLDWTDEPDGGVSVVIPGDEPWHVPPMVPIRPSRPDTLPEVDPDPGEAPGVAPVRSPRPVPKPNPRVDDVEQPASSRRPEHRLSLARSPLGVGRIEFETVHGRGRWPRPGVRIRVRPWKAVKETDFWVPRYRDTKFGRKTVWMVQKVINVTYGAYTELQDAVEVFAQSLYAPDGVSAWQKENGSVLGALQGYMEGRYRLDTVGFVIDFGINQASDLAYAVADAPMEYAAKRMPGWDPSYVADRFRLNDKREERGDVAKDWISWAGRSVRSLDTERSRRIRSLWSS